MKPGERLVLVAKQKGISQKELAKKLGVSASTVSDWANGKTEPKGPNLIKAVFVYDDHITITYNYIDESGRPRTVNIEDSGFPTDPVKGSTLKSDPPPKQNKANPFEDILVFQDCFALIIKIADRL